MEWTDGHAKEGTLGHTPFESSLRSLPISQKKKKNKTKKQFSTSHISEYNCL